MGSDKISQIHARQGGFEFCRVRAGKNFQPMQDSNEKLTRAVAHVLDIANLGLVNIFIVSEIIYCI